MLFVVWLLLLMLMMMIESFVVCLTLVVVDCCFAAVAVAVQFVVVAWSLWPRNRRRLAPPVVGRHHTVPT